MDNNTTPLRALLAEREVSQATLGRLLGGVGRTTVHSWCTTATPPDRIAAICDVLELDPLRAARFAADAGYPLPVTIVHALGLSPDSAAANP